MKDRFAHMIVLAASAALILSSCGLSRPPKQTVNYYTLGYAVPQFADMERVPLIVRVARFSEAADNNLSQMLFSPGPDVRNEYFYERWRAMPGDLASSFLLRDMQQCGLFTAAVGGDSTASANFRVEGRVEKFYELDLPDAWEADLSITVTLLRENPNSTSRLVVFQKTYDHSEKAAVKSPQAVAEAMSRAMAAVSRSIIADIHSAGRDLEPGKAAKANPPKEGPK
ncbi:MAG: hypothetical protein AB1921_11185 [Thermodesulfobacteriota bacterium]